MHKAIQNPDLKLKNAELEAICAFTISNLGSKKSGSGLLQPKLRDVHLRYSEYYGFSNWAQLKNHVVNNDCFYRKWAPVFVFKWFQAYTPALQYHKNHGGYLLRFWGDYVICGQEYINRLGLQGFEENWRAIKHNAVQPIDSAAWAEIRQEAVNNYLIINK
ncbi:MAG: hypothetical protein RLP14_09925 [Owenweeksia sp.]